MGAWPWFGDVNVDVAIDRAASFPVLVRRRRKKWTSTRKDPFSIIAFRVEGERIPRKEQFSSVALEGRARFRGVPQQRRRAGFKGSRSWRTTGRNAQQALVSVSLCYCTFWPTSHHADVSFLCEYDLADAEPEPEASHSPAAAPEDDSKADDGNRVLSSEEADRESPSSPVRTEEMPEVRSESPAISQGENGEVGEEEAPQRRHLSTDGVPVEADDDDDVDVPAADDIPTAVSAEPSGQSDEARSSPGESPQLAQDEEPDRDDRSTELGRSSDSSPPPPSSAQAVTEEEAGYGDGDVNASGVSRR